MEVRPPGRLRTPQTMGGASTLGYESHSITGGAPQPPGGFYGAIGERNSVGVGTLNGDAHRPDDDRSPSVSHLSLVSASFPCSLASSINDLSGEAALLEAAICNNDTYQVKRLLQLHHEKFQMELPVSSHEKSSGSTASRVHGDTHSIKRTNTFSDRYEVGRGSDVSSDGTDITSASPPLVFANALHLAVDSGATDVIRLILKYGVEPNRAGTVGGLSIPTKASSKPTPKHSPTGLDRRSLAAIHPIGRRSPSPRASPRGSPRCSPRSSSPRPPSPGTVGERGARLPPSPLRGPQDSDIRLRPVLHRQQQIQPVDTENTDEVASKGATTPIPPLPSTEATKSSESKKEAVTRRVSWVPEVEEKKTDRRDRPTYKRRHSAIIRSSEKTIQRQRSFSLDSQQQTRLDDYPSVWVVSQRGPVISTEKSTTRIAEPKGERDRREPRYFTFAHIQWDGIPTSSKSASGLALKGSKQPSGLPSGEGEPVPLLVLPNDVPRERLVVHVSSDGTRFTFADVYTRDYLLTLPVLFLAAARGNASVIYLLLKHGARPNITDALGNTPLHVATCQKTPAWESVLDLLEFGAPIMKANNLGVRPIDLQPNLAKLQHQLVLDCFLPFEPVTRPDPEPPPQRDLAPPVKPPSSILKRLQGVASRDKAGVGGERVPSGFGGSGKARSQTQGSSSGGREREEEISLSSLEGHHHSSGSIRSRSSCHNEFRSKELTLEALQHLSSRRRIRKLHEEGMDAEHTPEEEGKMATCEAEKSLLLLKNLSSSVECFGYIIRGLLSHSQNMIDFYGRRTDTHLHSCFSSLLHHLLKNCLEVFVVSNVKRPPSGNVASNPSHNNNNNNNHKTIGGSSAGNGSSPRNILTSHLSPSIPFTSQSNTTSTVTFSASVTSPVEVTASSVPRSLSFMSSSRTCGGLSQSYAYNSSCNLSQSYHTSPVGGLQLHHSPSGGVQLQPSPSGSSQHISPSSGSGSQLQQPQFPSQSHTLSSHAQHISSTSSLGNQMCSNLPSSTSTYSFSSLNRTNSSNSSLTRLQASQQHAPSYPPSSSPYPQATYPITTYPSCPTLPTPQQQQSPHSYCSAGVNNRKESAAAIIILARLCATLLSGVQEMQFTAMTTLNKIIDAAIVHRIGDFAVDPESLLQPPIGESKSRKSKIQLAMSSPLSSKLSREVSADGGGASGGVLTPDTIPGRGSIGHYGKWMLMWKQQQTKDLREGAEVVDPGTKDNKKATIIGTLAKIPAVSILNVMHNAITLHKRIVGAKQQCTPSLRWRHCRSHCLQILSARVLLFMTHCPSIQNQLVDMNHLRSLVSALDTTHDPQLLCLVLQVVATLALNPHHHKSLLEVNVPDALTHLILPSDEWYYTNHSTRNARFVKHHAARILVYLGLQHRVNHRVNVYDLLLDEAPPPTPLGDSSEDAYIMMTSAAPPLVTTPEGTKVLGMSVEGMVLQTLYSLENKKSGGVGNATSYTTSAATSVSAPFASTGGEGYHTSNSASSGPRECSHNGSEPRGNTTNLEWFAEPETSRGGCSQGLKRVWVCGRSTNEEGPISRKLLSCLLVGLPLVLHPVIFLRLLLHRLLSSMQQLTKWKSRSSWASHSSDLWRARSSSTDTDASTLRRRRKVNLTLDFAENASEAKVATPATASEATKEHLKAKTSTSLKAEALPEQRPKRAGGEHPKVSSCKSHTGAITQKQSQQQRQQRQFGLRHHSSDNQRDHHETTKGWRLRETLVALSALDVSDTLHQFLPSRLRPSDSRTSLSSSSKTSTPAASPSFFNRKSFCFSGTKPQKEEVTTTSSEAPKDIEEEGEETTPTLSGSRNLEEYIIAFQRQLVNLPSYERGDHSGSSLRPRSRSVPRVTFEGEMSDRIPKATPVTRSPSLTPDIARTTQITSPHLRSSRLLLPISATHLSPAMTTSSFRPMMSIHPEGASSFRSNSPHGRGHATSTPLHSSPQRSPVTSRITSPSPRPQSLSPFLSPSSQHASPNSVLSFHCTPRLLSPAMSPISPPKQSDDIRRPSSASSSVTPTPYRRLDSPVYIVVDIPAVHRAVLSCVEEWLESGGVEIESNPVIANELSEFLTRVSQCGPPYQQWCDDLKTHWKIEEAVTMEEEEDSAERLSEEYRMLQQLVVSGDLACSKEDAASLACIQLRIEETWAPPAPVTPTPTPIPTPMHHMAPLAPSLKVHSPSQLGTGSPTFLTVQRVIEQPQQQEPNNRCQNKSGTQYSSTPSHNNQCSANQNGQQSSHSVFSFCNYNSSTVVIQTATTTQLSGQGPNSSPAITATSYSTAPYNQPTKENVHLRIPSSPLGAFPRRQSHPQTHTPSSQVPDEEDGVQSIWDRAPYLKKHSIPASDSFVGGAGDLFRGCYGALDPHKTRGQPILALQTCLPPHYWKGKNITRLIREQKRKLFHTPVYDSELALKKLYIQTVKRLPAFACNLHHVKELLRGKTKKKQPRLLGIGSNNIVLLDTKSKILAKSQQTQDLVQWRTGGGRSHDRLVLEFRGTKWTFSVATSSSLTELGRALWSILKAEDALSLPAPIYAQATTKNAVSTDLLRKSAGADIVYSEELEGLQKLLHFPEEVALRLTEVEYELFYSVPPIAYVRHVTTDLRAHRPKDGLEEQKSKSVTKLIKRFNEVSSWVTHLIVSQPTHEDRKSVLSCIVRVAAEAWNIGNFNAAMEVVTGLKSEKLKPFWLSLEAESIPVLDRLSSFLLGEDRYDYECALDRAINLRECRASPFFGAFLQQLHNVLTKAPSLVVLAEDGQDVEFIADYCGEDGFLTRIGPGGLINMAKLYEAHQIIDRIKSFHQHCFSQQQKASKAVATESFDEQLEEELDEELEDYNPVEPLRYDHRVTLLPLPAGAPSLSLDTLQFLHHGTTVVHWDIESGRSCLVYLRLERCNGTLTWCKPSWSGLKASHSSSQPDFNLGANPEDVVSPGLLLKYQMSPELTGGSLDEGFLQISSIKEVVPGCKDANIAGLARRYFPDTGFSPMEYCVTLTYGSNIADNRLMGLMAPPTVAPIWCRSLQMLVHVYRKLSKVSDKRLYWLKEQYLKLYFENEPCSKPKPAEAIKIFGGRNWVTSTGGSMSPQDMTIKRGPQGSTRLKKLKSQATISSTKEDSTPRPSITLISSSPAHTVTPNRRPTLAPTPSLAAASAYTSSSLCSLPQPLSSDLSLESSSQSALQGVNHFGTTHSPSMSRSSIDPSQPYSTGTNQFSIFSRERSRSGGPAELMGVSTRSSGEPLGMAGRGSVKKEPLAQAAELDFADFVALYKSFSLRARKDLRELFKTLAVTRKSLSDSSLDEHTSPSSPPTPPYTKLGANNNAPLNAKLSSYLNQPQSKSVGLLTRNTSLDLLVFRNNCHKKKIFDAIAAASIIINCAGAAYSMGEVITLPDLRKFLEEEQGEQLSDEVLEEVLERHEPDPLLRAQGFLSFEGFARFLMDEDNYAFREELMEPQEDDMNYPMSHYYIASSHNTYLTGNQIKGESSVELYSQVLLTGCRCIELDCWDGDDGSPIIYHGHTFTTKIPFKNVVETINRSAFVTSPYPVILSIENHCSLPQQSRMAQLFQQVFGDKLVTKFLFESDFSEEPHLPSPSQLLYKIIIKNKKLMTDIATGISVRGSTKTSGRTNSLVSNASTGSLNDPDSDDEDDEFDDEDEDHNPFELMCQDGLYEDEKSACSVPKSVSMAMRTDSLSSTEGSRGRHKSQSDEHLLEDDSTFFKGKKQSSQISKELSDLVNYCQAVKFNGFNLSSPRESVKTKKVVAKKGQGQNPVITNTPILVHAQINSEPSGRIEAILQPPIIKRPLGSHPCYQCSSLNENTAKRLCRRQPLECLQHNETQLMRTYPAAMRIDSSNFNPLFFWAFGIQMSALNYQTDDTYLHLNESMFEQNGKCGYVLKPRVMWDRNHVMYRRFNPFEKEFDGLHVLNLRICIISGQYVCSSAFQGSPQVEVEILGIPVDCSKYKTKVISRNAFNPIWNDTFEIRVLFRDLAFLRFTVTDVSTGHMTAQRILPLNCLRQGHRHVRLRSPQNAPLPVSTLFIRSKMEVEEYEIRSVGGSRGGSEVMVSSSSMKELEPSSDSSQSMPLKRRKFFVKIHGVVPDEPYTVVSATQDCTTKDVIAKATAKIGKGARIEDYILIEEVAKGWRKGESLTTQRILDISERPLEAQAQWKGDGKFLLKKTSDDPSTRAWLSSIMSTAAKAKRRREMESGSGNSIDEDPKGWLEGDTFLVCVSNVSSQIPYTILKAPTSSTAQDILAQALVKARRMEDPSRFVLVEELEYGQLGEGSAAASKRRFSRIERRILADNESVYQAQASWKTLGKLVLKERDGATELDRHRAAAAAAAISSTLSTAISKVSRGRQERRPVKETVSDPSTLSRHRETFTDRRMRSLHDAWRAGGSPKVAGKSSHSEGETLSDDDLNTYDIRAAVQKLKKVSINRFKKVWR